ncbi:hypothetical protein HaLaN_30479, partial [Haematococcus lacustris]
MVGPSPSAAPASTLPVDEVESLLSHHLLPLPLSATASFPTTTFQPQQLSPGACPALPKKVWTEWYRGHHVPKGKVAEVDRLANKLRKLHCVTKCDNPTNTIAVSIGKSTCQHGL